MSPRIAASMCAAVLGFAAATAPAADGFPERKVMQSKGGAIEYSAGDEAYATALAQRLPLDLEPVAQPSEAEFPITLETLRERRAEILEFMSERLALPAPTADMGKTYDVFANNYALLQTMGLIPAVAHFALWRKPEVAARLDAGQAVAGFSKNSRGEIEFSVGTNVEFREGDAPEKTVEALRASWNQMTWPIKIEGGAVTPEAEVELRLADIRQNAHDLGNFLSAEMQRLAVMAVLHETTEATLVREYLHSADRRWFCEGVANYVAYLTLEKLAGADTAKLYYDVDAQVAQRANLRDKVDLAQWRVLEDPKSKATPADINEASYVFATKAVFEAFAGGEQDLLAKVLRELSKTPREKAGIKAVYAAYRTQTGRDLRSFIRRN
jgi:hypothetical protein